MLFVYLILAQKENWMLAIKLQITYFQSEVCWEEEEEDAAALAPSFQTSALPGTMARRPSP